MLVSSLGRPHLLGQHSGSLLTRHEQAIQYRSDDSLVYLFFIYIPFVDLPTVKTIMFTQKSTIIFLNIAQSRLLHLYLFSASVPVNMMKWKISRNCFCFGIFSPFEDTYSQYGLIPLVYQYQSLWNAHDAGLSVPSWWSQLRIEIWPFPCLVNSDSWAYPCLADDMTLSPVHAHA